MKNRDRQGGFSLLELLVAIGIVSLLLVIGAPALRNYWLTQSLESAADETVSQFRQLQARVVSESHPLVYGARLIPGSDTFDLVRYDPLDAGSTDDTCTRSGTATFNSGVFNASVHVSSAGTSIPDSDEATICRTRLRNSAGNLLTVSTSDVFVFFYSRGTATAGTLRLFQPNLNRTRDVFIASLTGRVTRT